MPIMTDEQICDLYQFLNNSEEVPGIVTGRVYDLGLTEHQRELLKANGLDQWLAREIKFVQCIAAMRIIDAIVGHKKVLHDWNTRQREDRRMSEEEFDEWWAKSYGQ